MCKDIPMPCTTTADRFGDWLVSAREAKNLTQRALVLALAELPPYTEQWWKEIESLSRSVRRWENHENIPRGEMMLRLERILGPIAAGGDSEEEDHEPAARAA